MHLWMGQEANVAAAQAALHHRARMNGLAAQGKWTPDLEKQKDLVLSG
jgi:fructose-bisphosphate aldolase class I